MPKTTNITSFNRQSCAALSARVQAALQPLADEFGLVITTKGGTFTPDNFTIKVEAATISRDGTVQSREATLFREYAQSYGLDPGLLGAPFSSNGKEFVVVGLNPRAQRLPVIAKDGSGLRYKFAAETVKILAAARKAP